VLCGVVGETALTTTQVNEDRTHDAEVQTMLSVLPDSVPTSPTSPGAGAPVIGSQWPPHLQHQQMLQLLLLQRQQQRAPVPARPANAPPSPRSPADAGTARKGSAPEVIATDFGRAPCVAATASSAFRPVLTSHAGNWSPSRRAHEPRLPYFEVRDVTGDTGKRFFRPIADGAVAVATTTGGKPPTTSTGDALIDSGRPVTDDLAERVNQLPPPVSDANITGTSRHVPADTAADRNQAASSRTSEPPLPPPAAAHSSKYKTLSSSSLQSRSQATKQRRPYRSKTTELRLHQRAPATGSTASSPAVQRQTPAPREDRNWMAEDDDDDALFGSEAGSVALSSASARSRTKSDSSVALSVASQPTAGSPVAAAGSSSSVADAEQDAGGGGRRRSAGWALDRGPPPHGDHGGARSLRTSPFRHSPSPLIVRKLKSAAELLRESHQQRRSRPASSAQSARPPVTITGPEISDGVTTGITDMPSTTSTVPASPSAQDTKLHRDPQTSTLGTVSSLPSSETTISSATYKKTPDSSTVDGGPAETHSQSSSTVKSEKFESSAETTSTSGEPDCSAVTPSTDSVQETNAHEVPHSTVTTTMQKTVETDRGAPSKFTDSNWFQVSNISKTSK